MGEPAKKQVPIVEGKPRINEDGQANLVGIKCDDCGKVMFTAAHFCPNCSGENIEEALLSTKGKVWTYTIVHVSYGSIVFEPYAGAFVELEDGAFVHTPIVGCDLEDVEIGMEVELEIIKAGEDEDKESVVFAFKPVEAGKD
jgi:uncharacterized OB-fold protein